MAEILLLPVYESKRPPYWNSAPCFNSVIFMCLCVILHRPTQFRRNQTIGGVAMTSYRFLTSSSAIAERPRYRVG